MFEFDENDTDTDTSAQPSAALLKKIRDHGPDEHGEEPQKTHSQQFYDESRFMYKPMFK